MKNCVFPLRCNCFQPKFTQFNHEMSFVMAFSWVNRIDSLHGRIIIHQILAWPKLKQNKLVVLHFKDKVTMANNQILAALEAKPILGFHTNWNNFFFQNSNCMFRVSYYNREPNHTSATYHIFVSHRLIT